MSINASKYNNSNQSHLQIANHLIQLIETYEKQEELDIVVDLGAGSGNVTHLMATALNPRKVWALDIDHNMIDFANKTKTLETIEYLNCDLSGNWSSVEPTVRQLENNVSLLFSNMVITLIKNKSELVANIKKLLKKGCRAYFSFPIIPDFCSKLNGKEKAEFETYVRVPSLEQQLNTWKQLFEFQDFKIEESVVNELLFNYKTENIISFLPFLKLAIDLFCVNTKYTELSSTIQEQLLCLIIDKYINGRNDQVNWQIIDQLKSGQLIPEWEWQIVYLVVKSPM